MNDGIAVAFLHAGQGLSPDRVVADPNLNRVFLDECKRLNVGSDARTLNRSLLNLRKSGALRGVKSKRTVLKHQSDYRFAAEISVRFLERRNGISLDEIICDPILANEFDQIAAQLAPGGSALEYRWAALNLRKQQRLQPEILARVAMPTKVLRMKVEGISIGCLPKAPGLYMFQSNQETLYVGESDNLQNRVRKHLDHSDNKELARWFWRYGDANVYLELQVLEKSTTQRIRRALELELIRSRKPVFNVKR